MTVTEARFLNVGFEILRVDPEQLDSENDRHGQATVIIQMTVKGEVCAHLSYTTSGMLK